MPHASQVFSAVCFVFSAVCCCCVCCCCCSDLVVVHEALGFGHCHLALGVPMTGKFADVTNLEQLRDMPCWTEDTPLRVVTGTCVCVCVYASCCSMTACCQAVREEARWVGRVWSCMALCCSPASGREGCTPDRCCAKRHAHRRLCRDREQR